MNDFCFWFGLYNEFVLAGRLIAQIQDFYPDTQIICVTDGTSVPTIKNFGVTYVEGERLHPQKHGGLWCKRMFQTYLEHSTAAAMIRVEPDTFINRRFTKLPRADVAGNILELPDERKYIHGGCVWFSCRAANQILDSDLLDNQIYAISSTFGYQRYQAPYLMLGEQSDSETHGAQDVIFSDVIEKLNLKVEEWTEVYSRVRSKCPNPQDYAVIHPIKYV